MRKILFILVLVLGIGGVNVAQTAKLNLLKNTLLH